MLIAEETEEADEVSEPCIPEDVPGYLSMPECPDRDEARRAWVIARLCDENFTLIIDHWRDNVKAVETYLKTGEILAKPRAVK